jgi:hypothetical protein
MSVLRLTIHITASILKYIMNNKQRENLSKLLYKIAEITFAGVVIANLIPGKEFNKLSLLAGIMISFIAFLIAYWIDGREG